MQKHVSKRLGCVTAHGGEEAIKHHSFFRDVKWKDLEDRKIKPPFRPKIVSSIVHFRSLRRILFLFIYIILLVQQPITSIYNYLQKSKKDVLNFDPEFTKEEPVLTPVNPELVRTINQEEFAGFSFYNQDFGKLTLKQEGKRH